jgi:hypothetical protein
MRRWPSLVLAAILLAAASPTDAQPVDRCAVKGSKTVRGSQKVRVYEKDGKLFGCVRDDGLTRTLWARRPAPNELQHWELVRAVDTKVAFVITDVCTVCGDPGPFSSIHVVRMRSGETTTLGHVRGRPKGSRLGTRVDALVLDACGRVAYRAVLDSVYGNDQNDPDPELHTWAFGVQRRVDRGAIVRSSIRLRPDSVEWVRDGEERSAPFVPAC